MQNLPGYNIDALIHESDRLNIFRGCRLSDSCPVIIKILKPEMCTPANISRLANEYELTRKRPIPGVLPPLAFDRRGLAIIMEDQGGIALPVFLQKRMPGTGALMGLLIQMTAILDALHRRGLVHSDLHPDLFLVEPETGQVSMPGCGAALASNQAEGPAGFQGRIAGTLAYISPEHSGRLTGGIDERSDLYSLGIIAYEIFCRRLPFEAGNPFQWIHAHMTRPAAAPENLNPRIPAMISAIIMKLIAKNPGDRYQTASGLLADLKECQLQRDAGLESEHFPLGRADAQAGTFARASSSARLYGREREIADIQDCYEAMCQNGRSRFILIRGAAGTGKTVLVQEVLKRLAEERGIFISCQFDQLGDKIPYLPLAQAFSRLMTQLAGEDQDRRHGWKNRLSRGLGPLAGVISEFVPEIQLLLGPQPPVERLGPQQTGNRFQSALRQFVRMITAREHPAVIFMDDLQWADPASLQLLAQVCVDRESRYLLVVGAFREEEEAGNPYLRSTLAALEKAASPDSVIVLEGLARQEHDRYVANVLAAPEFRVQRLSRLLHGKTRGNPLYLEQMIQYIFHENLLWFSPERGAWEWDEGSINAISAPDDIIALILRRLFALPVECNAFLNLAAGIGGHFELSVLARLGGKTPDETRQIIDPAVQEGLILNTRMLTSGYAEGEVNTASASVYEFAHGCIRQAAYMLVAAEQKPALHLKIGRILLEDTPEALRESRMPMIADNMNRGRELLEELPERLELAACNLTAGRRAMLLGAPDSAWHYIRTGLELLPEDPWREQGQLACELHLEGAQSAGLSHHDIAAETLFLELRDQARTSDDKAGILCRQMALYSDKGRFQEAVDCGLQALNLLGMRVQLHPSKSDFMKETMVTKWRLRSNNADVLLKRLDSDSSGLVEDPRRRQILETISLASDCARQVSADLGAMLNAKTANLALEDDRNCLAGLGYIEGAQIAEAVLKNPGAALKLRELALKHAEKYGNALVKCKVAFATGALMQHWNGPALKGLEYLQQCIRWGREAGDCQLPGNAYIVYVENAWITGQKLDEVFEICWEACAYAERHQQDELINTATAYLHMFGRLINPDSEEAAGQDADVVEADLQNNARGQWSFHFSRMAGQYLLGEWEGALASREKIAGCRNIVQEYLVVAEYDLYQVLVLAASWEDLDKNARNAAGKTLREVQQRMQKWASIGPENFLASSLMVEAEIARLKGQGRKAEKYYDQAIKEAGDRNCSYHAGLAAELAARYYLSAGHAEIAGRYIQEAGQAFEAWGAAAKVRQLVRVYPGWLAQTSRAAEQASRGLEQASANKAWLYSTIKRTMKGDRKIRRFI